MIKTNSKREGFGNPSAFSSRVRKKGDVPITILVIEVLLLSGLALISFYTSSGSSSKDVALSLEILQKVKLFSEETRFYKDTEINQKPDEIMNIFSKVPTDNPSYIAIQDNGVYKITGKYTQKENLIFGFGFGSDKTIFSVEYRFKP